MWMTTGGAEVYKAVKCASDTYLGIPSQCFNPQKAGIGIPLRKPRAQYVGNVVRFFCPCSAFAETIEQIPHTLVERSCLPHLRAGHASHMMPLVRSVKERWEVSEHCVLTCCLQAMKVNAKLGGINAVITRQYVTWMDKEPFMVLGERAFSTYLLPQA